MPKNVFAGGSTTFTKNGSTEFRIASSTGLLYSNGNPIGRSETGSTATNLTADGVSFLAYSSAANTYTLDAPVTGVIKSLVLGTTLVADSTAIAISVYTGSTAIHILDNSTAIALKLYANFLPPMGSIQLVGLSTILWGVLGTAYGTVQLTTAAGYTT
jgi:hypothetical protein